MSIQQTGPLNRLVPEWPTIFHICAHTLIGLFAMQHSAKEPGYSFIDPSKLYGTLNMLLFIIKKKPDTHTYM